MYYRAQGVSAILRVFSQRTVVEQIVMDYILPLPSPSASSTSRGAEVDEVAWTDTMKYLEERSTNAMLLLTGLKQVYVSSSRSLSLPPCESNLSGDQIYMTTSWMLALKTMFVNNIFSYSHVTYCCQGGIIDENEEQVTQRLNGLIQHISRA